MSIASPRLQPGAPVDPEDLIKEARRRQRRRWLAGGAALLIVSAAAAAVIGDTGASSHPQSPGRSVGVTVNPVPSAFSGPPLQAGSGVRLLLSGTRPAWFSLATGEQVPIKGLPRDRLGYVFIRVVGGWSAQPSTAGPACGAMCPGPPVSNYFIADGSPRAGRIAPGYEVAASDRSGAVWLITFRRSGADITTAPAYAQEVTTAGRRLGPRYELPAGYLFRRAVGGDLLLAPVLEAPQGTVTYKLWDPATARVVRTFSDVIAAGPEAIAWGPICVHCPVHVLSLQAGTAATIPLPRGTWAAPNQGTFSPDDRYLAFPLWAGTAPDGEPALTRIAVIDVASPSLLIVPGSAVSWDVNKGVLTFGWQPAGHKLIAVLPGSGQMMQVASWQPGQAGLQVAVARIPAGTSAVLGEYG